MWRFQLATALHWPGPQHMGMMEVRWVAHAHTSSMLHECMHVHMLVATSGSTLMALGTSCEVFHVVQRAVQRLRIPR